VHFLLALALLSPLGAEAQVPLEEAVSVAGDDGCLSGPRLAEHLATFLGASELATGLRIVVEATGGRASFEILETGERAGVRTFERLPRACEDRHAVLALAIAMTLDETVLDAVSAPTPAPVPPLEIPTETVEPPEPPSRPDVGVALRLEASVLAFVLPEPSLLAGADVALLLPEGFSVHAAGLITSLTGAPLGVGAVEVGLVLGRGALCLGRSVAAPLSLEGCVGVAGGTAHARGIGFAVNHAVELPTVLFTARLEARFEVAEILHLFLFADGWLSTLRPRFLAQPGGEAHTLGEGGLSLGGAASFVLR
jgi:hypothetical protein